MSRWHLASGILAALIGFAVWPNLLGAGLPIVLLWISWLATFGPSFKRSARHFDINAVLHTPAMQMAMLRPGWTPRTVSRVWHGVLALGLLMPGMIIAFWPQLTGIGTPRTPRQMLWWISFTPLILCAGSFFVESLIRQVIATPVTGTLILLCLLAAPLGVGLSERPEWTWRLRTFAAGTLGGSFVLSLWVVDMFRALNPLSVRAQRLRLGEPLTNQPLSDKPATR